MLTTNFQSFSSLANYDLILSMPSQSKIIINWDQGYNSNPEAKRAFEYAAQIWERLLVSSVPITIDATFTPSDSSLLGSCYIVDYDISLANSQWGYDLNPYQSDMEADLNSSRTDWYFGLDGNTPSDKFDFVAIALHEICHGLGILGRADYDSVTGKGYYDNSYYPFYTIYDRFVGNNQGQMMEGFSNYSTALGDQFTSNNLEWFGQNGIDANGGVRPKLYAPSSWEYWSSYAHLDEATYSQGSPNSLMTPYIDLGKSVHHPGAIILGMLEDLGWTIPYDTEGDTIKKALATSHYGNTNLTSYQATIGDGVYFDRDVDMYKIYLDESSDRLIINVKAQGLDSVLRITDALGNLLAIDDNNNSGDSYLYWNPSKSSLGEGWYYLSVSGKGNQYNPHIPYSGTGGSTGFYQLSIDTVDVPDAAQYCASHEDLIRAFGWNPEVIIDHYVFSGRYENRSKDRFDELRYVASYDDLINYFGCHNLGGATQHYIQHGFWEQRNPTLFDGMQYIASYTDLLWAFGNDSRAGTEHFINHGYWENRSRDRFDELGYVASYDDLINCFGCHDLNGATQHPNFSQTE